MELTDIVDAGKAGFWFIVGDDEKQIELLENHTRLHTSLITGEVISITGLFVAYLAQPDNKHVSTAFWTVFADYAVRAVQGFKTPRGISYGPGIIGSAQEFYNRYRPERV